MHSVSRDVPKAVSAAIISDNQTPQVDNDGHELCVGLVHPTCSGCMPSHMSWLDLRTHIINPIENRELSLVEADSYRYGDGEYDNNDDEENLYSDEDSE